MKRILLLLTLFAAGLFPAAAANNTLYVFGPSATNCKPLYTFVDGGTTWTSTQACFPSSIYSTSNNVIQSAVYNGQLLALLAPGPTTAGNGNVGFYSIAVTADPSISTNWSVAATGTTTHGASFSCSSGVCIMDSGGVNAGGTTGTSWANDGASYWASFSISTLTMQWQPGNSTNYYTGYPGGSFGDTPYSTPASYTAIATSSTFAGLINGTTIYGSSTGHGPWTAYTTCSAIANPIGISSQSNTFPTNAYFFGSNGYCSASSSSNWAFASYPSGTSITPTGGCSAGASVFVLSSSGTIGFNGTTFGAVSGMATPTACSATGTMSGILPAPNPAPSPTSRIVIVTYS